MPGTDIGSHSLKVAVSDASGRAIIVPNLRGDWCTRHAAHKSASGVCTIGDEAVQLSYDDSDGYVSNCKPYLGTSDNLLGNGRQMTALEVYTHFVQFLIQCMERATNTKQKYIVTVRPVTFQDAQTADVIAAHERCGLEVLQTILEPVAAAIAHGLDRLNSRCVFVVVDIGHYTTDICVVIVEGKSIKVSAVEGVCIAGRDFDAVIASYVLDALEREWGARPDPSDDPLFAGDFQRQVEQGKVSLGTRAEVRLPMSWNGRHTVVTVNQAAYQRGIEPHVKQILDALDRAMAGAGLKYEQLDQFLAVGGSSRSQLLRDRLAKHIGMSPRTDVDPDRAVVYGASILCHQLMRERGLRTADGNRILPGPRVFLQNVNAHDVGCTVLDRATGRLTLSTVIPKNTPIPCDHVEEFYLEYDDQTEVVVEILQGNADADRTECHSIGTMALTGLPKEAVRTQRVRVECRIDANGLVWATVIDKVSGMSQSASVGTCEHLSIDTGPKLT